MPVRILIATAQVRGIFGTGGLGDVAAGLAYALNARPDTFPRLVLPAPTGITLPYPTRTVIPALPFLLDGRTCPIEVLACELPADPPLTCYLLQAADQPPHDSPAQGVLLSRAALALADALPDFTPDVIHANDWHAGLIAAYRDLQPATSPRPAVVFTTHNLGPGFQGEFHDGPAIARLAGLDSLPATDPRASWIEPAGRFSFAGEALAYADQANTVSPTYARELLSPRYSGALSPLVNARPDFQGILNGIDTTEWNPATDKTLGPFTFDQSLPIPRILAHKRAVRQRLRDFRSPASGMAAYPFADLADSSILLAAVSRIDHQKLPILVAAILDLLDVEGVQLALLGEPHPRDGFGQHLAARLETLAATSAGRFLFYRGFDPELSHRIYAAADMLLVPSLYEPCGLTQLIAMRYGTIPVVRATGGLADTVADETTSPSANGFSFLEPVTDPTALADEPAAAQRLVRTVARAINVHRQNPVRWAELVRNAMARDSSWNNPADAYVRLYREACFQ